MKKLFTSNYQRNGTNPLAIAISNAEHVPADYSGHTDSDLGPSTELVNSYHDREIDHDAYSARYLAELSARGLSPQSIIDEVDDGSIFVCFDYEDGDPSICHRFILAEWLNDSGLASVTEI